MPNSNHIVGPFKVLVVDDDSTMRKLITLLLNRSGIETAQAASGAEAVQMIKSVGVGELDLVLLDYMMPEFDGHELLMQIRKYIPEDKLPIFFLSGLADRDKIIECMKHGAQDFIVKPIDKNILLHKVGMLFGQSDVGDPRLPWTISNLPVSVVGAASDSKAVIVRLTEDAGVVLSATGWDSGTKLTVECPDLGMLDPSMAQLELTVNSCQKNEANHYFCHVDFVKISDTAKQAIRKYSVMGEYLTSERSGFDAVAKM